MKKLLIFLIVPIVFIGSFFMYTAFLQHTIVYEIENGEVKGQQIKLTVGKTLQFQLYDSYKDIKSVCELRVPENYSSNKPTPLLVWFSSGQGSHSIKDVPAFVDFKEYFVLALPYLNNQLPRLAIKQGSINAMWEYDKVMLDFVRTLIPNLSHNRRIAAGFSSGAHFVGAGLDLKWSGFTDFFTAYILHEGGYSPNMEYKGIKSTDKVLVTYGDAIRSYGKVVADAMVSKHLNIDVYAVPNTGHEINEATTLYVRNWIERTFTKEVGY